MAPRDQATRAPVAPSSRSAPSHGGGGGARRRARGAQGSSCSRAPRRGARDGCSRTSSTTTSERRRPEWWAWFRWPQLDDDELVRDRTAIGGLEWDKAPPEVDEQSHVYRATFPLQEHKLDGKGWSPDGDRPAFRIAVDDDAGRRQAVPQRQEGGRAASARAHTGPADPELDHPRGAAALRACLCRR